MPPITKTPPLRGEASCAQLAGWTRTFPSLDGWQMQFPILALHCGPEWLAMIAAALLQGGVR